MTVCQAMLHAQTAGPALRRLPANVHVLVQGPCPVLTQGWDLPRPAS